MEGGGGSGGRSPGPRPALALRGALMAAGGGSRFLAARYRELGSVRGAARLAGPQIRAAEAAPLPGAVPGWEVTAGPLGLLPGSRGRWWGLAGGSARACLSGAGGALRGPAQAFSGSVCAFTRYRMSL